MPQFEEKFSMVETVDTVNGKFFFIVIGQVLALESVRELTSFLISTTSNVIILLVVKS